MGETMKRLALVLLALPLLLGAGMCGGDNKCQLAKEAEKLACQNPESNECKAARAAVEIACKPPAPSPTVAPTPEPTPCPCGEHVWVDGEGTCNPCPPIPTPIPTPTPVPTPTPTTPPTGFPVRFPLKDAVLSLNNKAYGQGFDATLVVEADPALCLLLHGQQVNKCHFDSSVFSSPLQRAAYEMAVMGGARVGVVGVGPRCQVWQYLANGKVWPCNDDHDALASCDHMGRPQVIDDPQTPTTGDTLETLTGFEGEPKECGLMRNEFGPYAGFFTIAHGKAQVRSCLPLDNSVCGPWREFDR